MPHTAPRHNDRRILAGRDVLEPNLGLYDTPRHSQRGLVNRGSAVRVRSPASEKGPANWPYALSSAGPRSGVTGSWVALMGTRQRADHSSATPTRCSATRRW